MGLFKTKNNTNSNNEKLIDLISPFQVDFSRDSTYGYVGERFTRVFTVTQYPLQMEYAWLSKLTKIKNVSISLFSESKNKGEVTNIMKIAYDNLGDQVAESTQLEQQKEMTKRTMTEEINTLLYEQNYSVFFSTLLLIAEGDTLEDLENTTKILRNKAKGLGIDINILSHEQEEAYKMASPLMKKESKITEYAEQMFLSPALAGSYIQNSTSLKDETGVVVGRDIENKIVIMSPFTKDPIQGRNNFNMVTVGESGSGKTATNKKILLDEYAEGADIIIIDPEREVKKMCESLGGTWVNMGGGRSIINPLEIRKNEEDDDGLGAYAQHIRILRLFFSTLLKDFSQTELKRLEELIEKLYEKYNITKDIDVFTLKPSNYPKMSDLYELVKKEQELMQESSSKYTERDYDIIESIRLNLRSLSEGADSKLFEGITNIDLSNDFIVFDIFDLQDADESLKSVQYFNILSFAFQKVVENRNKKVILMIDEAHMLLDKDVLETAKTLRNFQKRFRKYNGSLLVSTQEINDFTMGSIADYGKAILDNATYKILLGADGKNLEAMIDIYKLNNQEESIVTQKIQGQGLLLAGNKRMQVQVDIADYEFEMADI
ncbi:ATP-binding protein [Clostridiaceae bacterium HSG29]|nr:ATP-binding protein [Clostridiaceae bacterium HSG29]